MKKIKISKKMKDIRSSTDYDLVKIVNEMKQYYDTNIFENKVLLKRLRELKLEKFYTDSLQSSVVGVIISVLIIDLDKYKEFSETVKLAFVKNLFLGIGIVIISIIGILLLSFLVVALVNFTKYLQSKIVRSEELNNYLDEVEEKIIKDILQNRIENIQE